MLWPTFSTRFWQGLYFDVEQAVEKQRPLKMGLLNTIRDVADDAPHDPRFAALCGHALQHSGRSREAIPRLEAAVRLHPDNEGFNQMLASALQDAGGNNAKEQAIRKYKAGLKLLPLDPLAYHGLGSAHFDVSVSSARLQPASLDPLSERPPARVSPTARWAPLTSGPCPIRAGSDPVSAGLEASRGKKGVLSEARGAGGESVGPRPADRPRASSDLRLDGDACNLHSRRAGKGRRRANTRRTPGVYLILDGIVDGIVDGMVDGIVDGIVDRVLGGILEPEGIEGEAEMGRFDV